jgi:predicted transcriptional regulator
MASTAIKQELRKLVDGLPEDSTWEDALQAIYERAAIQRGFDDIDAGRFTDIAEVREEYGLDP